MVSHEVLWQNSEQCDTNTKTLNESGTFVLTWMSLVIAYTHTHTVTPLHGVKVSVIIYKRTNLFL